MKKLSHTQIGLSIKQSIKQFLQPWSIRRQLMIFLFMSRIFLMVATWGMSYALLQPCYDMVIRGHLEQQVDEIVALMDTATENGIVISTREDGLLTVDQTFQETFLAAMENETIQLASLCVNVADKSLAYVVFSEGLHPCLLHTDTSNVFDKTKPLTTRDTKTAIALRNQCFTEGEIFTTVASSEWQQMVVGKRTADGNYVVIVSASLSNVSDASLAFLSFAPFVTLTVLAVALVATFYFSNWFTKPISDLINATYRVSNGNYDITLPVTRKDELGVLTQQFNQMTQAVHHSTQLQRDLVANITHDLRTPLTVISGYAETIREITGDDPEKRNAQLDIILDECDGLTALVNSILEYSKLSSGVLELEKVHLNLTEFCQSLMKRYHPLCAQYQLTLQMEIPPEPHLYIDADPALLKRALDNLLTNAFHHVGKDRTVVFRLWQNSPTTCRIEIEDHGEGIATKDQVRIFSRYYRARSSQTKQGTGLGLPISYTIIQQHDFNFKMDSKPGRTIFFFTAPCLPPNEF